MKSKIPTKNLDNYLTGTNLDMQKNKARISHEIFVEKNLVKDNKN